MFLSRECWWLCKHSTAEGGQDPHLEQCWFSWDSPACCQPCAAAVLHPCSHIHPASGVSTSLHAPVTPCCHPPSSCAGSGPSPMPPSSPMCSFRLSEGHRGTLQPLEGSCSHPASCGVPCLWGDTGNPSLGTMCSPKAVPSQLQHPTFQQSTTKCACM